jgi:hypothetical protein
MSAWLVSGKRKPAPGDAPGLGCLQRTGVRLAPHACRQQRALPAWEDRRMAAGCHLITEHKKPRPVFLSGDLQERRRRQSAKSITLPVERRGDLLLLN